MSLLLMVKGYIAFLLIVKRRVTGKQAVGRRLWAVAGSLEPVAGSP